MFKRCPQKVPRTFQCARGPSASCLRSRFNSSVPERVRKLPNARTSFFSTLIHDWLLNRWVLLGVGSGVVATQYFVGSRNDSFATYILTAKEPISSTASIFHLKPKEPSHSYGANQEAWRRGIWNVQFVQPQLQIVRAYTPLPPLDEKSGKDIGELRFLIRHDPHGEVSSYLHRLPPGAEIQTRGPYLEYEIAPDARQVIFFAGGTGIAPALQVARALLERESPTSEQVKSKDRKLHILWANRSREDCLGGASDELSAESLLSSSTWSGLFPKSRPKSQPLVSEQKGVIVQELETLKTRYPAQVTVEYFVNSEDTWIDENAVSQALSRFDDKNIPASSPTSGEQRQILISGPPGFIAHLAGPKEWKNGREEQGAVSKIVAHALAKTPHNVKVWKI